MLACQAFTIITKLIIVNNCVVFTVRVGSTVGDGFCLVHKNVHFQISKDALWSFILCEQKIIMLRLLYIYCILEVRIIIIFFKSCFIYIHSNLLAVLFVAFWVHLLHNFAILVPLNVDQ